MIQVSSGRKYADFGASSRLGSTPAVPSTEQVAAPSEPPKPFIPPGPWAADPTFKTFVEELTAREAIDFLSFANRITDLGRSKGFYGSRSRDNVLFDAGYKSAQKYILSSRKVRLYLESKNSYESLLKTQLMVDSTRAFAVNTRNTSALEQIRSSQISLDAAKKQVLDNAPWPYLLEKTWMPTGTYTQVGARGVTTQGTYDPPSITINKSNSTFNPVASHLQEKLDREIRDTKTGPAQSDAIRANYDQYITRSGPYSALGEYDLSTTQTAIIKKPTAEVLASLPPELSTEPGWFKLRDKAETVRILQSSYDEHPDPAYRQFATTEKTWTLPANLESYKKLTLAQREAYTYRVGAVFNFMFLPFANALVSTFNRIDAAFRNISKAVNNGISEAQKIAKVLKPILDGMLIVGVAGMAVGAVLSGGTALLASGIGAASGAIGGAAGAIVGAAAGPAAGLAVSAAVTKYAGEFAYRAVSDVFQNVFGNSPVLKGALAIADYAGSGQMPSADDMKAIADKYAKDIVQKLDSAAQSKLLGDVKSRVSSNVVATFSTELKMSPDALQAALDGGETELSPRLLETLKELIGQSQSIALVTVEKTTGIKTGAELPYETQTDILAKTSQESLDAGGFADAKVQANISNMAKALGLRIMPAPDTRWKKGERLLAAERTVKQESKKTVAAQAIEIAAEKKFKEASAIVRATKDKLAGIQARVATATTAESKQAVQNELLTVQEAHKKELEMYAQVNAAYKKALQGSKVAQLKNSVLTIAAGQARYYPGFEYAHPFVAAGLIAAKV